MKFAVIGLGSFGYNIAKTLYEKGNEVVAIDFDKEKINKMKEFSSRAIKMDSSDKENLLALGIHDMDVVVVCLGPEMEDSILTVLFLKEIGARQIIAKALTEDHAKILEAIGATEVIFPEKDMAVKTALKLSSPTILESITLTSGIIIQEIAAPKKITSKSLKELDLRNKYGIQIIAIKELVPEKLIFVPKADFVIKESDVLIIIGDEKQLEKINDK